MDRLLKEERLPSMRLGLTLTTVEVEIEEEGEIDAAEAVIKKAIRINKSHPQLSNILVVLKL
jgi:hypothetical protein